MGEGGEQHICIKIATWAKKNSVKKALKNST